MHSSVKYIIVLLFFLVLESCTKKFYDRNGKVFRLPFEQQDKLILTNDSVTKYIFSAEQYPFLSNKQFQIRYINTKELSNLVRKNKTLIIIFYYPICPQTEQQFKIAKYAKDNALPYLLVSTYNDQKKIHSWNDKFGIDNAYSCIAPSTNKDSLGILTKKVSLITSICDSCSIIYKDELLYVDYVIATNYGGKIHLNIEGHHYSNDNVIAWINELNNIGSLK